ncbi:F-box/kelch-repeat protein [Spatholobus suberectus]|nr:F-box/kelch-repeat protein [Spatholobus suberectus]
MDLPKELLIEVFLRLSVKSLVHLKCVCKEWRTIISDSQFTKTHYNRAPPRKKVLFIAPSVLQFLTVDVNTSLDSDSTSAVLQVDLLRFHPRFSIKIMGSCRGFLLLEIYGNLYVWNPSTNYSIKFDSSPPILSTEVGHEFSLMFNGLGYDPCSNDFLVMLIFVNKFDSLNRMQIFSITSNLWKDTKSTYLLSHTHCSISVQNESMGLLFKDAIHWVVFSYDMNCDVLHAYDVVA